jgi:hypothetical protein
MKNNKIVSIRELWKNEDINWVTSYATILKYVTQDYTNYFKPISKGSGTGRRYFVKMNNVRKFKNAFKQGLLA